MNYVKCSKNWTIRIPAFSEGNREKIHRIANANRISVGGYIGNLLDQEIKKMELEAKEAKDDSR